MALQTPFFGKREPEAFGVRNNLAQAQALAPRPQPLPTPPVAEPVDIPVDTVAVQPPAKATGSTLTVGPNIKLKGVEITDCDTLVVEGTVEATMDSRLMQITAAGAFKGSADIDIAEIHGAFDGELTVRDKLVIYATGRVTGKVRYGKLVIEEGGQLSGEIAFGTAKTVPVKAPLQSIAA
ncbi:polymer-forming cytoskeletal protein [Rhodoferax sp. WC2427]|uniref:bactofilin family protein n=1 Tax=Rhodoferax sp. WC2427 TaxID=3234144 RepID=UPI003467873F